MIESIQISLPIVRLSHYIKRILRHKRIEDVVGLRTLADEDWIRTQVELKKISKDTLGRLEF